MTPTRSRRDDASSYNPDVDRASASAWNRLDTGVQRFIAIATAGAFILVVCAWASDTIHLAERVSKLESAQAETNELLRANLAVSCILARKVDPTIEPTECSPRPRK